MKQKKKYKVTLIDKKGWKKTMTINYKPTMYIKMPLIGFEYLFEMEDPKKLIYRQTSFTIY